MEGDAQHEEKTDNRFVCHAACEFPSLDECRRRDLNGQIHHENYQ
jgi:hypothetical protein